MSKRCARCEKTVYPLEELKCLDKIWHKGCFKCQECGMTLSMKTYKGFNKLPYCEAHIPKAKATTVAETPEMRRLAENTKIQSNVQYHADFEKNKAKFTQVADDPETQRLKKNTKIISNVAYHGELERKAEMERKRSEPGEENEECPPWHEAPGRDVLTATSSVHPSTYTYDDAYEQTRDQNPHSQQPHSYEHPPPSSSRTNPPQGHYHPQTSNEYQVPVSRNNFPEQHPPAPFHIRSNSNYPAPTYDENPRAQRGYPPPGLKAHNANTYHPSDYIEQSAYYSPNHMGGQTASNNRYSDQPTNGSSGSYPSTNRHGASHTYYPTNSHYATGAPQRDESKRQQEQHQHIQQQHQHQQQQQQQQQHHQQMQKHHQQLQQQQQAQQQQQQQQQQQHQQQQQQHQQHQQQSYGTPHQQYGGAPPSSQHRHPSQSSSTSFLHHHHQQPHHPQHHHQSQQPQQKPQIQTSSYHHHPAPQNMYHDANHNSPYSARTSQTLIYSSQTGPVQQQPNRRVGSIADYDPVNEQYGSISQHSSGGYRQETSYQVQRSNLYGDPTTGQPQPPQHMNSNAPHHKVNAPPTQLGRCYRAMYDYEAADTDEVSFKDGDLIINCTAIDEGWMTGTIQRTGVTGMLPANYVERVS